jgi:mycothiol synthase
VAGAGDVVDDGAMSVNTENGAFPHSEAANASAEQAAALPPEYVARPLTYDDASAVYAVAAAQEEHDIGSVEIEEADILSDWARPSFDVGTSTVGVFEEAELIAYAEVNGHDRGDAAVLPAHLGRGIGTWLARWMQRTVRDRGGSVVGMPVPLGSDGDRLLRQLGYRVRWESWLLELPEGKTVPRRPLPEGYVVRAATEQEYPACWTVVEDAFLEWSVRDREPFEDWLASVTGRPGFQPWQLRVVTKHADEIVAVAVVQMSGSSAFISRLATRRDERGQGLAQALLVDAFAVAQEHGATKSELSTDSRTGALGLYEKVGMEVTSTWVNRAVDV